MFKKIFERTFHGYSHHVRISKKAEELFKDHSRTREVLKAIREAKRIPGRAFGWTIELPTDPVSDTTGAE